MNYLQIRQFCFIFCFEIYLLKAASSNANKKITRQLPIILGWNNFFDTGNVIQTIAPREQTNKCLAKCIYSDNKNDSSHAAAIIFHGNLVDFKPPFPAYRHPNQLYVFFTMEAPYSAVGVEFPVPNFFNLSMTYRVENSLNLHAPYGSFQEANISNKEDLDDMWDAKEILEKVRQKHKSILYIASNCSPPSGRQFYVEKLSKFINITKYGKCADNLKCDQQCYNQEIDQHFFYLAFENAVCDEYLTEKFWNPLRHLTVPIILSRGVLDRFDAISSDSFIAASDFASPEELAKFLKSVQNDEAKYLSYFRWTRFMRKSLTQSSANSAICRLCELAHQKLAAGTKIIENIHEYWHPWRQCMDNLGQILAENDGQNLEGKNENEFKTEIKEEFVEENAQFYAKFMDFNLYLALIFVILFLLNLLRNYSRKLLLF